jgi:hypothetical protein
MMDKESTLRQQIKNMEITNTKLQQDNDKLLKEIEALKCESYNEIQEIKEDYQKQIKDKDKVIRQLKNERDSLFDELKNVS